MEGFGWPLVHFKIHSVMGEPKETANYIKLLFLRGQCGLGSGEFVLKWPFFQKGCPPIPISWNLRGWDLHFYYVILYNIKFVHKIKLRYMYRVRCLEQHIHGTCTRGYNCICDQWIAAAGSSIITQNSHCQPTTLKWIKITLEWFDLYLCCTPVVTSSV